ncbi:MAG: VOC family protein [Gammaproteobacteria bacterium]|jgi:predicted enzyme related to lactoylglutathione lyase
MRCLNHLLIATALSWTIAAAAQADVSLNSVRVAAKDAESLGRFYQSAFGLKETNRLSLQNGVELFLNFGESVEAARANSSPQVVIMQTEQGPGNDDLMHVIFTVSDAVATAAAVRTAGGTVEREPMPYGNSGMMIGFVVDPEGNHIELIQPASP